MHNASVQPIKQGWLEKRSVSAPSMFKNWRRRRLVLWSDRIHWHRGEEGRAAGELRFGPGTTVLQKGDADAEAWSTLSVACAGRVLVLRGTALEVRMTLSAHATCTQGVPLTARDLHTDR